MAGGVACHGVQRPGAIEHRWGDIVESVVGGADADKAGHNIIDGSGLTEGPCNCRGVVASWGRCLPGRGGADGAEDGLLEDQRHQFEVRDSDDAFGVGEADQILGDVGWPIDAPGVVFDVFIWVYPYPLRLPGLKRWCSRGQKRADGPAPLGRWGGLSYRRTGCSRT